MLSTKIRRRFLSPSLQVLKKIHYVLYLHKIPAAVSFLSLNHLVTLQQKVQTLSNTVQDISTDANTLISQADQLDELREQESSVQTTTGETTAAAQSESPEPAPGSEQEGTLSPSSGTTFTDNTDSSMDNLLGGCLLFLFHAVDV